MASDAIDPELQAEVEAAFNQASFSLPENLLWPTVNALIELMASLDPDNPVFAVAVDGIPSLHPSMTDDFAVKYKDDLRDWVRSTWMLVGEWLGRRHINYIQWASEIDAGKTMNFFIGAPTEGRTK